MSRYDVVVAGGGLAGLTAGLFSARCGCSTLVLAPEGPGGTLVNIGHVEEFPAIPQGIPGFELGPLAYEQAADAGAELTMATVTRLEAHDGGWLVAADTETYEAGAVIVATGSRPRRLGVPGEEELFGKGVSHCASCDGPLFRDRTVAVLGGGDSALLEALELTKCGTRVVLLDSAEALCAQETYQRRVRDDPAIEVRHDTVVAEILGDSAVAGARTRDVGTGEPADLDVSGVFIYVGREPNTAFLDGVLPLGRDGRVPTDARMRTERPGLFAAGDVRSDSACQAITAAGDGATAAIAADAYLRGGTSV
ncbi:MAG: NAD(P)/FAD-dependent oxidoreductase [Streptosporangiaceae bacterium]